MTRYYDMIRYGPILKNSIYDMRFLKKFFLRYELLTRRIVKNSIYDMALMRDSIYDMARMRDSIYDMGSNWQKVLFTI